MGALTEGDDDANTPLDPEALAGLIPSWVATRSDLNEAEAGNVASGLSWLAGQSFSVEELCTSAFVRDLHQRMFGDVWRWAGQYRTADLNLGIAWWSVTEAVEQLMANFAVRLGAAKSEQTQGGLLDTDLVDLHHQLVSIHPFANGNGRHARAVADAAAGAVGLPTFTWGRGSIHAVGSVRSDYLQALRHADAGDIEPLVGFARS